MKLTVHKMHNCKLCNKCIRLLQHWNIAYWTVYDKSVQDRPYPYITVEYEYEELVDMIAKGVIKCRD